MLMSRSSAEHYLDVSPEATFQRLVVDRLGGTYCYGHHHLFLGVIRALGYRSYTAVARMNFGYFTGGEPSYAAFGHMVLLVQLGPGHAVDPAHTWLVDVAPGPPAPVFPMPLSVDPANILPGATAGERHRFTRGFSPKSSLVYPGSAEASYATEQAASIDDHHALWQVEYDAGPDTPRPGFGVIYQFGEQEYDNVDFMVQHYAKMFKPHEDVFWDDVVAFNYFLADEGEPGAQERKITERPLGKYSLFRGVVKKRFGMKVLEQVSIKSEEERVAALKKYFGITVEVKSIAHIKGRDASLAKMQKLPPEMEALA